MENKQQGSVEKKDEMTLSKAYTIIHNEVAKYRAYVKIEEALLFIDNLLGEKERLETAVSKMQEEEQRVLAEIDRQRHEAFLQLDIAKAQTAKELLDLEAKTRDAEIAHNGKMVALAAAEEVRVAEKQREFDGWQAKIKDEEKYLGVLVQNCEEVKKDLVQMQAKKAGIIKQLRGVIDGGNS